MPTPTTFGPQYCETPAFDTGFPVEPANTISSVVIVLYGIAALVLVMRRAPRDVMLYVLCALLIVNGTGSVLWHGLRTGWALALDTLPAIVFVVIAAFLWARKVAPLWQAATVGVLLLALPFAVIRLNLGLPPGSRIAASAAVIALAGAWLVTRTSFVARSTAIVGGLALGSAVAALTFRIIDTRLVDAGTCSAVPFGVHFLWHIFLSTAAYLCVLTLVQLREKGISHNETMKQ